MHARGILYAPDYVINAGGLIACYADYKRRETKAPLDEAWIDKKVAEIGRNLGWVFEEAGKENTAPHRYADAVAQRRIGRG